MTYMPSEKSMETYNRLLQKWGADNLLENLRLIMADNYFEMYMEELDDE